MTLRKQLNFCELQQTLALGFPPTGFVQEEHCVALVVLAAWKALFTISVGGGDLVS